MTRPAGGKPQDRYDVHSRAFWEYLAKGCRNCAEFYSGKDDGLAAAHRKAAAQAAAEAIRRAPR